MSDAVDEPMILMTGELGETLFEIHRVEEEGLSSRSWLIDQDISSSGALHVITPLDPVFIIASYLSLLPSQFMPYADLWEAVISAVSAEEFGFSRELGGSGSASIAVDDISNFGLIMMVRKRMETVCEKQNVPQGAMYRLSLPLILAELRRKMSMLVDISHGLFGPSEKTELEAENSTEPAIAIEVGPTTARCPGRPFPSLRLSLGREGVGSGAGLNASVQLEARERATLKLFSNYLPDSIMRELTATYTFSHLMAHVANTQSSSVLSATYLPGRSSGNSAGGGGNAAATAKAKKAASKGSMGVEALKKVSTTGMRKLDSFFKPSAASGLSNLNAKKRKTDGDKLGDVP